MNTSPTADNQPWYLGTDLPCLETNRGALVGPSSAPGPCPHPRHPRRNPTVRCRGNEPFFDRPDTHIEGTICHACTLATIHFIENRPLPAGVIVNPLAQGRTPFRNFYYDMWIPVCHVCRARERHWFYWGKNTCICSTRIRGWKCHACLHHAHQRTLDSADHYRSVLQRGVREARGGPRRQQIFVTRGSGNRYPDIYCRCGRPRDVNPADRWEVMFCLGCRGTIVDTRLDFRPPLDRRYPQNCPPDIWPIYENNTDECV